MFTKLKNKLFGRYIRRAMIRSGWRRLAKALDRDLTKSIEELEEYSEDTKRYFKLLRETYDENARLEDELRKLRREAQYGGSNFSMLDGQPAKEAPYLPGEEPAPVTACSECNCTHYHIHGCSQDPRTTTTYKSADSFDLQDFVNKHPNFADFTDREMDAAISAFIGDSEKELDKELDEAINGNC